MQWLDESAKEAYELLIANGSPVKLDTYCEKHHIVPRSLGGSDDAENLVYLTAGEHLYAHYWLWVGTGEKDMGHAYFSMVNTNWHKYDDTPLVTDAMVQAYEEAKIAHSKCHSERMSGENHPFYGKKRPEHSIKMSGEKHPMYGKKRPDWSESIKGENNPMYGVKHTEEWRMNMSARMSGENHPLYGRTGSLAPMYGRKGSESPSAKAIVSECGLSWPSQTECAEHFGVTRQAIAWRIKSGKHGLSYAANNDVSTTGDYK